MFGKRLQKKSYYAIILFKERLSNFEERSGNLKMNDVEKPHIKVRVKKSEPEAALPRKTVKNLVTILLAMLGIIICLSVATIVLAVKVNKNNAAEDIPEPVADEPFVPVVNNRVYDFYNEDDTVILDDPVYGYVWLRAFTNVPKHDYDYSGLKLENGRYTYSENGEVVSKTGIDVSYHQNEIDWDRVAADGIDFVILRVGYRGYESGLLNLDQKFHSYIKGATAAGLDVGVYFFSQALTTEEAVDEANFVMEQLQGYNITYPVVFDWEIMEDEGARTQMANPYTVTECAAAFCDTIADGGYIPMVYGSRKFALMKLDMSKIPDVNFWFAEYKDGHNEPTYPYDYQIWQYASDGRVDGIDGDVDMNICMEDFTLPVSEPQEQETILPE